MEKGNRIRYVVGDRREAQKDRRINGNKQAEVGKEMRGVPSRKYHRQPRG